MIKGYFRKAYSATKKLFRKGIRISLFAFILIGIIIGGFIHPQKAYAASFNLTSTATLDTATEKYALTLVLAVVDGTLPDGEIVNLTVTKEAVDSNLVSNIYSEPVSIQNNGFTHQTPPLLEDGNTYYAHAFYSPTEISEKIKIVISNGNATTTNAGGLSGGDASSVTSTKKSGLPECGLFDLGGCIARIIYYLIFVPTSFIMALMGQLLDFMLEYTLDSDSYSQGGFIREGWKLVRDISNIAFIFILLYAAIGTILSIGNIGTKKLIGTVIIVALLINFSLFLSSIIVDAGNIVGRVFYTAMGVDDSDANQTATQIDDMFAASGKKSVSVAIVSKFNPQTLFDDVLNKGLRLNLPNATGDVAEEGEAPPGLFIVLTLVISTLNIMTALAFATVAFLFVGRVVGIWLALIFSPVAFISLALPQGARKHLDRLNFSTWLNNLVNLAFLAPVFLFFMYLILKFLNTEFLDKKTLVDGATTMNSILNVLVPFIIIYTLIKIAQKTTVKLAGEFGEMAQKAGNFVSGAAVGLATGGAAFVGRTTIGAAASSMANSKLMDKWKSSRGLGGLTGRLAQRGTTKLSKSSFDLRSSPVAGQLDKLSGGASKNAFANAIAGTDISKGGYAEMQKRRQKAMAEQAEARQMTGDEAAKQRKKFEDGEKNTLFQTGMSAELARAKTSFNLWQKNTMAQDASYTTALQQEQASRQAAGRPAMTQAEEDKFRVEYIEKSTDDKYKEKMLFNDEKFKTSFRKGEYSIRDQNGNETKHKTSYGDLRSVSEINQERLDKYREELRSGDFGTVGALKQTAKQGVEFTAKKVFGASDEKAKAAANKIVNTATAVVGGTAAVATGGVIGTSFGTSAMIAGLAAGAGMGEQRVTSKAGEAAAKEIDKKFKDITDIDKELNILNKLKNEAEDMTGKRGDEAIQTYLEDRKLEQEAAKAKTKIAKRNYKTLQEQIRSQPNPPTPQQTQDLKDLNDKFLTAIKEQGKIATETKRLANYSDQIEKLNEKKKKLTEKEDSKDKK